MQHDARRWRARWAWAAYLACLAVLLLAFGRTAAMAWALPAGPDAAARVPALLPALPTLRDGMPAGPPAGVTVPCALDLPPLGGDPPAPVVR